MNELLLILVLLSDPASRPTADAIAQRFADEGVAAKVVIGPDALAQLRERGLTESDLVTQPAVGVALTTKDRHLAVVRIDRQVRTGNIVVQSQVWAGGHSQQQVAISGTKEMRKDPAKPDEPAKEVIREPQDATVRDVVATLAPWIAAGGASPAAESENRLADLAEAGEWAKILAQTETVDKPTPRQRYYRIVALLRSERRADADAGLAAFRAAAPNHVLLNALDLLFAPPVDKTAGPREPDINNAHPEDDGSNVLR